MKIKVEADMLGSKSKIFEVKSDGSHRQLMNVRNVKVEVDVDSPAMLEMRIDLSEVIIEGVGVVKVCDKEGRLRTVKRIEYVDGGSDEY